MNVVDWHIQVGSLCFTCSILYHKIPVISPGLIQLCKGVGGGGGV